VSVPVAAPVAVPASNTSGRVLASPLAKKMAQEKGIDIASVPGSGEAGRIVKRDVDHYVPYNAPASAPVYSAPAGTESFEDETVSQMRKTIARRLAESKFTAPHFYLTLDIDMDNAIAARKSLNSTEGVKVSFNDMVVKAVAMSLRQHPAVNSAWLGDVIRRNHHVHIGVAVAVEDGLLVPVVRFADTKGFQQIGNEVREYAKKAKDKKLQPSDWEGNTFTISNLGMFGIESFTAIINPPDSCILAVGGIKEVPVVKKGQVVPGNVMKVTLSCDHRVVDGASGAAFLQTFKGYMENPVTMLL
jgi:pyruvate dehydrogenase E2 component (dihydrolipoamide acetyltransferase)